MLKILSVVLIVILALLLAYIAAGFILPHRREVVKSYILSAAPADVYVKILDVGNQPKWRKEIKRVEILEEGRRWVEINDRDAAIEFRVTDLDKDKAIAIEFLSKSGFRGRWSGKLEAMDDGRAKLDVEESIEVDSILRRPLSYLFFNFEKSVDRYVAELESNFAKQAPNEATH